MNKITSKERYITYKPSNFGVITLPPFRHNLAMH